MSFLDSVILPTANASIIQPKVRGGFLDSVVMPSSQDVKVNALQGQLQVAKANADYTSSFGGMVKNAIGGGLDYLKELKNSFFAPTEQATKAFIEAIPAAANAIVPFPTIKETTVEKVANVLKLGTTAAQLVFSPISGASAVAEKLPILKPANDLINNIFSIPGGIGEFAGDKFTDALPISQQAKDTLRPVLKEIGSLAGQIWLGGKIIETLGTKGDITKSEIDVLKEQAKTIAPESPPAPGWRKIEGGFERIPAETSQPIKSNVKGGFLESVQVPQKPEIPLTIVPESKTIPNVPTIEDGTKKEVPPQPIEGTGKEVISTRGADVLKAAVEKKLTDSVGELPTHNQMDMKEQSSLAVDFAEKNPEQALSIAKGEALPPLHILPESIYTALEIKAIKEGDVQTLQDLAQSKIPTYAGQRMKALDSADPNSPVKIMRDIQAAREAKLEKTGGAPKAKKAIVDEIKTEIKKTASKRPTWEEFINQVKCNS